MGISHTVKSIQAVQHAKVPEKYILLLRSALQCSPLPGEPVAPDVKFICSHAVLHFALSHGIKEHYNKSLKHRRFYDGGLFKSTQ